MAYIDRSGFTYYSPGGEQRHTRAPFLILASECEDHSGFRFAPVKLYACVRRVALGQFGHFMMGNARVAGHTIVISGAYGSDGLPVDYCELAPEVRAQFREVPGELAEKFWHPEHSGWNSAGSEYPDMASWARAHLAELAPARRRGGR